MSYRSGAPFWVVEDTTGHLRRNSRTAPNRIDLRLYRVAAGKVELVVERSYEPGSLQGDEDSSASRAGLLCEMIRGARVVAGPVVFSHSTTSPRAFAPMLLRDGINFVAEVSPKTSVRFHGPGRRPKVPTFEPRLRSAAWEIVDPAAPASNAEFHAAVLGVATFAGLDSVSCFALSTGGISGFQRGRLVGVTSLMNVPTAELAHLLGWVRWIRVAVRRDQRTDSGNATESSGTQPNREATQLALNLPIRPNLQIAKRLDEAARQGQDDLFEHGELRGIFSKEGRPLNVVELFAGAGGMGLGFLLANGVSTPRFRIVYSGEVHPVYANTLRTNHNYMRDHRLVPDDAVPRDVQPQDLSQGGAIDRVSADVKAAGGVDVLIGGPPCQGFSSANRNSSSSSNPNNQLVDTFLDYADALTPRVLLMENVQGILWTQRHGSGKNEPSVAGHVLRRLEAIGYEIFPKLLDAAWFGVPQHRNRFFLLGLHRDFGYRANDFGRWGPFPFPTHGSRGRLRLATVRDAIFDLPRVENGYSDEDIAYIPSEAAPGSLMEFLRAGAPANVLYDHVVSRQAEYVIARYRKIPQGGNWQNVTEMMTNYSEVGRTHSNIYRRLQWKEPSITIGHYRKSMIIHPVQHRGLSLREAARLQSFPDWFRFAGGADALNGGLTHKQQQLANAVCPLISKAMAEFVAKL